MQYQKLSVGFHWLFWIHKSPNVAQSIVPLTSANNQHGMTSFGKKIYFNVMNEISQKQTIKYKKLSSPVVVAGVAGGKHKWNQQSIKWTKQTYLQLDEEGDYNRDTSHRILNSLHIILLLFLQNVLRIVYILRQGLQHIPLRWWMATFLLMLSSKLPHGNRYLAAWRQLRFAPHWKCP